MAAQKRMFDRAIIETDNFLDLPDSGKALYFLLGMEADDEGFVSTKRVMRLYQISDDNLKILVAKKFVIPFESGVVVITDWHKNNWLDSRRIKTTEYKNEKEKLALTEAKEYVLSNSLASASPEEYSIEESSIEENSTSDQKSQDIPELIKLFEELEISAAAKRWYANKTQRGALDSLLKKFGRSSVEKVIRLLPKTNKQQYMPKVTTPYQLEQKWFQLRDALIVKKNEINNTKPKMI